MDAPPACVAKASSATNSTNLPDLSNSTVADPTATDIPTNTTSTDGTLDSTSAAGNSTDTSSIDSTGNSTDTSNTDTTGGATTDNSTVTDTSNSTDTGARRRRRGIINSPIVTSSTTTATTEDIVDLAFEWQSLCLIGGGGIFIDNSPCVELAGVHGFNALLADADPCVQQTFADSIITWAKSTDVVNKDDLIAFAVKYRRYPRTAVSILGTTPSTLYCTQAPINPELSGIVNAQPDGVNPGLFGSPNAPMVPFGSDGTCPFGMTADVSTCTCIADSTNGTDVGVSSDSSTDNSTVTDSIANATATATADDSTATDASATASADDSTVTDAAVSTSDPTATDSSVSDAAAPTDSTSATDSSSDVGSTATDTSAPAATPDSSGLGAISGNIHDPDGRRRK
ncbi:hypothetical protein AN958_06492 [Leucoagaricus sp. SymC.cos]|nr:hypothetical protein AN958_06492 [Leucoagaricus sp. SymC.cos]